MSHFFISKLKRFKSANLEKNKIKESIEKIQKENGGVVFREISLLNNNDFMDLILDINRNIISQEEKPINNNDVINLVKLKEKLVQDINKKIGLNAHPHSLLNLKIK